MINHPLFIRREPEPGKIASEDPTLGTYLNLVWAGNGLILNNGKVKGRAVLIP
jgi:hypothetical protein